MRFRLDGRLAQNTPNMYRLAFFNSAEGWSSLFQSQEPDNRAKGLTAWASFALRGQRQWAGRKVAVQSLKISSRQGFGTDQTTQATATYDTFLHEVTEHAYA